MLDLSNDLTSVPVWLIKFDILLYWSLKLFSWLLKITGGSFPSLNYHWLFLLFRNWNEKISVVSYDLTALKQDWKMPSLHKYGILWQLQLKLMCLLKLYILILIQLWGFIVSAHQMPTLNSNENYCHQSCSKYSWIHHRCVYACISVILQALCSWLIVA